MKLYQVTLTAVLASCMLMSTAQAKTIAAMPILDNIQAEQVVQMSDVDAQTTRGETFYSKASAQSFCYSIPASCVPVRKNAWQWTVKINGVIRWYLSY